MQLRNYDNRDGYALTLNQVERKELMDELERIGGKDLLALAAYSGARRDELAHTQYKDIRNSDAGFYKLRIFEDGAKRSKYREAPVPRWLAERLRARQDVPDDLVPQYTMRTYDNRLKEAAQSLAERDEAWRHLSMHDLRRTAINSWLDNDAPRLMCMQWSGHDDWRTFRDHYLSDFSEAKQSEVVRTFDW